MLHLFLEYETLRAYRILLGNMFKNGYMKVRDYNIKIE